MILAASFRFSISGKENDLPKLTKTLVVNNGIILIMETYFQSVYPKSFPVIGKNPFRTAEGACGGMENTKHLGLGNSSMVYLERGGGGLRSLPPSPINQIQSWMKESTFTQFCSHSLNVLQKWTAWIQLYCWLCFSRLQVGLLIESRFSCKCQYFNYIC